MTQTGSAVQARSSRRAFLLPAALGLPQQRLVGEPTAGVVSDFRATPANPVPDGLAVSFVTASDGRVLRAAHLRRPRVRGTIVVACGRGDYIERWFETIGDLARRRFDVAIFDFRGQGGSQRRYADRYRDGLRSFSEYDDDLESLMRKLVLPDCVPPFYALGHSTGGLVILRALRTRTWFEKAVLCAPLLGIVAGAWPMPVVRLMCALMPAVGLGRVILPGQGKRPLGLKDFTGNNLTADKARYVRSATTLDEHPVLGVGGPTFGWLAAALRAMDGISSLSGNCFRAPVLIVGAGRDRIVATEAQHQLARRVAGVSCVVIPEARHEILCESDAIREQFFAAFDTFIP